VLHILSTGTPIRLWQDKYLRLFILFIFACLAKKIEIFALRTCWGFFFGSVTYLFIHFYMTKIFSYPSCSPTRLLCLSDEPFRCNEITVYLIFITLTLFQHLYFYLQYYCRWYNLTFTWLSCCSPLSCVIEPHAYSVSFQYYSCLCDYSIFTHLCNLGLHLLPCSEELGWNHLAWQHLKRNIHILISFLDFWILF